MLLIPLKDILKICLAVLRIWSMGFDDNLTIKLHPNDNVAIAFKDIAKEETTQKVKANIRIPQGHKIAVKKNKKRGRDN